MGRNGQGQSRSDWCSAIRASARLMNSSTEAEAFWAFLALSAMGSGQSIVQTELYGLWGHVPGLPGILFPDGPARAV